MGLMACSKCGSSVSDQAIACPRCGHPLRTTVDSTDGDAAARPARRREWITGIIGKPPSIWLWAVGPFVLIAVIALALDISSASRWAFPVAFVTYLVRSWPYWSRQRRLQQLDDPELQRRFAEANRIDPGRLYGERS